MFKQKFWGFKIYICFKRFLLTSYYGKIHSETFHHHCSPTSFLSIFPKELHHFWKIGVQFIWLCWHHFLDTEGSNELSWHFLYWFLFPGINKLSHLFLFTFFPTFLLFFSNWPSGLLKLFSSRPHFLYFFQPGKAPMSFWFLPFSPWLWYVPPHVLQVGQKCAEILTASTLNPQSHYTHLLD